MKVSQRNARFLSDFDRYTFDQQLKYVPQLPRHQLRFLTNCLGCLIELKYLTKLRSHEILHLKKILSPYRGFLHDIAKGPIKKKEKYFSDIRRQTGRGIILSSLIAAAVPLITSLISKLAKKK